MDDVPRRYKVRFPDVPSYQAALATENTGNVQIVVANEKRNFVSLSVPSALQAEVQAHNELDACLANYERSYHAIILEDFQYDPDFEPDLELELGENGATAVSLTEVLGKFH
jgi:hypothetical protein